VLKDTDEAISHDRIDGEFEDDYTTDDFALADDIAEDDNFSVD
jgi:hypothetical protein